MLLSQRRGRSQAKQKRTAGARFRDGEIEHERIRSLPKLRVPLLEIGNNLKRFQTSLSSTDQGPWSTTMLVTFTIKPESDGLVLFVRRSWDQSSVYWYRIPFSNTTKEQHPFQTFQTPVRFSNCLAIKDPLLSRDSAILTESPATTPASRFSILAPVSFFWLKSCFPYRFARRNSVLLQLQVFF